MPCQCGCNTTTVDEKSQPGVASEGCGCGSTASELERAVAELDQRLRELEAAR